MKAALLLTGCFILHGAAATEIRCPDNIPAQEVTLNENPPGRHGIGRVQPSHLSKAYMVMGELYAKQEVVPRITKVKGGMDIEYNFPPALKRWLVCIYGGNDLSLPATQFVSGNIEWWEDQDARFSTCILKIRETKNRDSRSDWSAIATCH